MQRLKTRAQFEAAMAGGTVSRTAHFVLHRAAFPAPSAQAVVPAQAGTQDLPDALDSRLRGNDRLLFAVQDEPWMGVVVPKRWAKRAVTRNGIKRQVYNVSEAFAARLPAAAHVVRLRSEFARKQFPSAWSEALKAAVRGELLQLFERAPSVIPAQAGTRGSP
ncbi:MAG: ribonuclease P protein component [Comamonadaceae bacterium]|nr:MAG: ribonuclease P protein component [Comamonadaceae bacterium]